MSQLVLAAALAWCLVALTAEVVHAASRGLPRAHAPARGSPRRGLAYAFGPGMLPWHKEGARRHPAVFVAGVALHLGVLAGLLPVLALIAGTEAPAGTLVVIGALAAIGIAGGFVMLVRRIWSDVLRRISAPDDYASNLLVSVFLAGVLAHAVRPDGDVPLVAAATALFVYAPLGKIRHCVFFPLARGAFAVAFGRRGVLGGARRRLPAGRVLDHPGGGGCR